MSHIAAARAELQERVAGVLPRKLENNELAVIENFVYDSVQSLHPQFVQTLLANYLSDIGFEEPNLMAANLMFIGASMSLVIISARHKDTVH